MRSVLRLFVFLLCSAAGIAAAAVLAISDTGHQSAVSGYDPQPADEAVAVAVNVELAEAPVVLPTRSEVATALPSPPEFDLSTAPPVAREPIVPVASAAPQLQPADPSPVIGQQFPGGQSESQGSLLDALQQLPQLTDALRNLTGPGASTSGEPVAAPGLPLPGPSSVDTATPAPRATQLEPELRSAEGDDQLSFNMSGMDLRTALEWLSEQGDLNIVATQSVQGIVNSAALNDVDAETALEVILESTGYVMRRRGRFITVGSPEDFVAIEQSRDEIATRIYRPNYVSASEIQTLITPLLSERGAVSVTTPSESGIGSDADNVGGDAFAGGDAILVRDYRTVLDQMDQIVAEVDKRPMQVAIEAMILSVDIGNDNEFGIDWQLLRDRDHLRFGLGDGNSAATLTDFAFNGGLAFAFLDSNLGSFVTALETFGSTNVIATPRLTCLNKQRAEILIGAELGYVSTTVTETQATQQVEFLRVGTELRLRPFVSSDGIIRMEVHPQLSTGSVRVEGGFTLPDRETTEVTTNIMTRDGCTVIIGGLMREDLVESSTQVPLLGSMPFVGPLFRKRNEEIDRSEILVLVTPHIVYEPDACCEGEAAACEFHRRQAVVGDHMNPASQLYLGRKYMRLAQEAIAVGDLERARRLVDFSIRIDPTNRAAIDLQADIDSGALDGDHSSTAPVIKHGVLWDPSVYGSGGVPVDGLQYEIPPEGAPLEQLPLDGEQIPPWMLDRLEQAVPTGPQHPRDPGTPGTARDIVKPPVEEP